ncbi:carboxypeptidase-like regulatory domain-containing protein [Winogradskyella sp.]|uniref:carboxypeptidase-like regulatory domain-containing protein n=1 Tax=Winogradskyella sp. TaxID=1883156 RepID=UPI002604DC1F|nr:carboxypeptidase-like regulatory domain-containing protein [Winogradskyella sp.]
MKTQNFTLKPANKTFTFIAIFMVALFAVNASYSQTNERTITGVVSNEDGPLPGANITLEGTNVGAVTDGNGEFKFPKKLKSGDVLIFSYLGYETQKIIIDDKTNYITLELTPDMVEMIGDLDTNTPYKTKRRKS